MHAQQEAKDFQESSLLVLLVLLLLELRLPDING